MTNDTWIFDKAKLLNNIKLLAKKKNMPIGQLESEAGVSAGYLSRQNSSSTRMDIGVTAKMAQILGTSVDELINVNLKTSVSATESRVLDFVKQVKFDTQKEILNWAFFDKDLLRSLDGSINPPHEHYGNPFFSITKLEERYDSDVRYDFCHQLPLCKEAKTFATYYINGAGYYVHLDNDSMLLIAQVRYIPFNPAITDKQGFDTAYAEGADADQKTGLTNIELSLYAFGHAEPLCNKYYASETLAYEIDALLREAKASTERVQLPDFTKDIIDSYMNSSGVGQSKTATPFGQGSNTFGATPSGSNDDDIPF